MSYRKNLLALSQNEEAVSQFATQNNETLQSFAGKDEDGNEQNFSDQEVSAYAESCLQAAHNLAVLMARQGMLPESDETKAVKHALNKLRQKELSDQEKEQASLVLYTGLQACGVKFGKSFLDLNKGQRASLLNLASFAAQDLYAELNCFIRDENAKAKRKREREKKAAEKKEAAPAKPAKSKEAPKKQPAKAKKTAKPASKKKSSKGSNPSK